MAKTQFPARSSFPTQQHDVDLCVVGGGMAGICTALAAARHGTHVLLMHDRPVLGGNASSECRMHICGADIHHSIANMRETGILEELRLENLRLNPHSNYSIWDLVLYDKVFYQPNLTLLLNCSCLDAEMDGNRITGITGWQLTTQTCHTINAKLFADCSGDGILAPLTGADFRMGREARHEYNESIAPETADARTMGMTCLFAARGCDTPQPFTPPSWAYTFDDDDLPYGADGHRLYGMGYWWVELGGEADAIRDAEDMRAELLRVVMGVWDHLKNRGNHGAENWTLEWIQFLPAKRESRRFLGDHVLTQNDVEAEGRFPDLVAYGGWSMDDHNPAGFWSGKRKLKPTIFHHAPSPYGIPYRALYSRNIANLFFAGRNASCTHAAMSSTRVMATCSVMGQAAGTAAALAVRYGLDPREVCMHIEELQQTLLADDCYLPWVPRKFNALTMTAELTASQGDPEPVRDGFTRPIGDDLHAWTGRPGDFLTYRFDMPRYIRQAELVLDSDFSQDIALSVYYKQNEEKRLPATLPRRFRLEGLTDGVWQTVARVDDNSQRLVRVPVNARLEGLRYVLEETRGADESRVYTFSLTEAE